MSTSPADRRQFSIVDAFAEGNPYPEYAWFRAHDPVHVGTGTWPIGHPNIILFRHADVMATLRDQRMIHRITSLPEVQAQRAEQAWSSPPPDSWGAMANLFMLFQDPPDHTRLRGLANRAFTPRVVAARRDEVAAIASDLVRAFRETGGEGDLITALAFPLPVLVIARVLGIPREDLPRLRQWAPSLGAAIDLPIPQLAELQAGVDGVVREMAEYLRALVARRRRDPQDDLLSGLIAARDEGGKLSDDELIATAILLMLAGHETTVNLIANGTLALLRHPDQWARLVADPALAANATEELLRYDSPVQMTTRIAAEGVEVGGRTLPRGTEVYLMLGSANRDEAVWDAPETVRIDRQVGRHMAFGMGIHFCLGAPLARLEGEIAFATLAREAPRLALVDPEPQWRPGAVLHGLRGLDVRLEG